MVSSGLMFSLKYSESKRRFLDADSSSVQTPFSPDEYIITPAV